MKKNLLVVSIACLLVLTNANVEDDKKVLDSDEIEVIGNKSADIRDEYSGMKEKIAELDVDDNYVDEDLKKQLRDQYGGGKLKILLDDIEPNGGPITGDTRILVRGGPFKELIAIYPRPKCRFGKTDRTVAATYVPCTTSPRKHTEVEAHRRQKNDTCLQCDNSPEVE